LQKLRIKIYNKVLKGKTLYEIAEDLEEDVDAIGSCIGAYGARIQSIVKELRGEKIDIVKYSENPEEYVAAALAPAEVHSVEFVDERICKVVVDATQLSLAIGKEGQNARLAAKLTGAKIDIKAE
jgi:N utilization substance protein A